MVSHGRRFPTIRISLDKVWKADRFTFRKVKGRHRSFAPVGLIVVEVIGALSGFVVMLLNMRLAVVGRLTLRDQGANACLGYTVVAGSQSEILTLKK
jgi:hypothetical protein